VKKPHDAAVASFQDASAQVESQNQTLDAAVTSAQDDLGNAGDPYDKQTKDDFSTAIDNAKAAERAVPDMPKDTEEIKKAAAELLVPLDYSAALKTMEEKQAAFNSSVKQMKQITNPGEAFVIERLNGLDGISGSQAVTEDHDPNGNLNKQGGYTAAVYFSSPWIDQSTVSGNDTVDKGTDCGGCVEVFASADDASKRDTYLSNFDGAGIFNPGSHHVLGTMVIRTSRDLTASQQNDLTQLRLQKQQKLCLSY